jgi:hypothetical protein
MKKALYLLITVVAAAAASVVLVYDNPADVLVDLRDKRDEALTNRQNSQKEPDVVTPEKVLLNVPFFSQAPTANWADPRQQDGCEEASIMMANLWLTGKTMTVKEAEAEIIAMSEWQKEKYGEFVDRSITDTGKMFQEYYGHSKYRVARNITAQDIKDELAKGNLVIVPTNGQILDNPNYTGEGPITHMMPVIGYDDATRQFITNDPGTRNGRQFKFSYDNLMDSIYDYETGSHVGYEKTETIMMVVEKK